MSAVSLADLLRQRGVRLRRDGDQLVVNAPKGALTPELQAEIRAHKTGLLSVLRRQNTLTDYAADVTPCIRLSLRETGDMARDFDLVGQLRKVIEEFQPGGNHVYVRIITLDGRAVVVEWRAVAERNLRLRLAHILARASQDEAAVRRFGPAARGSRALRGYAVLRPVAARDKRSA